MVQRSSMYGHLVCRQRLTGVSSVRTIGSSKPSTKAVPSTYSTCKHMQTGVSAVVRRRLSVASHLKRSEVRAGRTTHAGSHLYQLLRTVFCMSGILIWSFEDGSCHYSLICASLLFPYVYNVCNLYFLLCRDFSVSRAGKNTHLTDELRRFF